MKILLLNRVILTPAECLLSHSVFDKTRNIYLKLPDKPCDHKKV